MNALRINRNLAEITQNIDNLRAGTLGNNVDLLNIQRRTKAMQVELTSDRIIGGYRTDAVAQMLRVYELIGEAGPSPDHQSLLSIGMATELAVNKLNAYREMHQYAARNNGTDHELDQLAA